MLNLSRIIAKLVFLTTIIKCLATCLSPILNSIIDDSQCAFLKCRTINDYFPVAQETRHLLHSTRSKGVVIKLDFEKAFDHVNWEFLINTLTGFGFGSKWISWIKMCISTAKFLVLINESPKRYVGVSNGLKQLFILVTYVLNRMLCLATDNNLI